MRVFTFLIAATSEAADQHRAEHDLNQRVNVCQFTYSGDKNHLHHLLIKVLFSRGELVHASLVRKEHPVTVVDHNRTNGVEQGPNEGPET